MKAIEHIENHKVPNMSKTLFTDDVLMNKLRTMFQLTLKGVPNDSIHTKPALVRASRRTYIRLLPEILAT